MAAEQDIKSNFSTLEGRIQKLIYLHEALKEKNSKLLSEKTILVRELQDEKEKIHRLEEGYKNLKDMEKLSNRNSITTMKRKINDIILEIDRNMSMIEEK